MRLYSLTEEKAWVAVACASQDFNLSTDTYHDIISHPAIECFSFYTHHIRHEKGLKCDFYFSLHSILCILVLLLHRCEHSAIISIGEFTYIYIAWQLLLSVTTAVSSMSASDQSSSIIGVMILPSIIYVSVKYVQESHVTAFKMLHIVNG